MESKALRYGASNYLIVGSNGFIGNHLAHALLKDVIAPRFESISYIYNRKDFADTNLAILRSNPDCQTVIFCGGVGGFGLSAESAYKQGSQYKYFVHECSKLRSVKQFFLLSSLGAAASRMPSPYKDLCTVKEEATVSCMGPKGIIIRLPGIYGYSLVARNYKGLPGAIINGLKTNEKISIYGNLSTTRNYMSIEDAANALSVMIANNSQAMTEGRIVNLANRCNLSVHQVLNIICASVKRIPRIQLVRTRPLDVESHDLTMVHGRIDYVYSDLSRWSIEVFGKT